MTLERRWRLPLFVTGLLLMAHAYAVPPVWDAVTHQPIVGVQLLPSPGHLWLTPLTTVADFLGTTGFHVALWIAGYLVVLLLLAGGWRRGPAYLLAFALFLAWGATADRPAAALKSFDPDVLIIDFHSHSRYSHDGRKSFSPERNIRWHQKQGFHASFLTDHNRTDGSEVAGRLTSESRGSSGYRSLRGEEASLYRTHLVVLGNHSRVDNTPYDSDPQKIGVFIKDMHQKGFLVVASLPEYWRHQWGAGLDDMVSWGIDGFEVMNSAPKALSFPRRLQLEVIDRCRTKNLFVTGVSDCHGWGLATAAWNVVRLPGWPGLGPDTLEANVLSELRRMGFSATRVVQRRHIDYGPSEWAWWFAIQEIFLYWRTLSLPQVLIWVLWIWATAGVASMIKSRPLPQTDGQPR